VDTLAADAFTLYVKQDKGKLSGVQQRAALNRARMLWLEILRREPAHTDALHYLTRGETLSGGYKRTIDILQRGIPELEKKHGRKHIHVQTTLQSLATVFYYTGDYASAKSLLQEVLEFSTQELGAKDPFTLSTLSNLASSYSAMRQYKLAEKTYKKALKGFPEHDENALQIMSNFADVYIKMKQPSQALDIYTRALHGFEQVFGRDHPSTLAAMNGSAMALKCLQRYPESIRMYRLSLERRKVRFGDGTPKVILARWNLATALLESAAANAVAPPPLPKNALVEEAVRLLHQVKKNARKFPTDAQCRGILQRLNNKEDEVYTVCRGQMSYKE